MIPDTRIREISMKRFIQEQHRTQGTLLPECLDDYITEENTVRVIDAFVEELDLLALGFAGAAPAKTGRPAYHPAVLLKLYIYGYLNRLQSSRRLEKEAQRNVELMWLTGRLTPDFKTIANFRKDNGKGIQNVCRQFVLLCRKLNLITEAVVAIDGSKFKAVNHRDRNFTQAKLQRRIQEIEANIARYLAELDTADRQEPEVAQLRGDRLKEKLTAMRREMAEMKVIAAKLEKAPDGQISLTDPDARSMKTRGSGVVGYNVQAAVETRHHLIVEHEVTNEPSDRGQSSSMATKAGAAMRMDSITAIFDRGYYNSKELLKCEQAGIAAIVPKADTSGATAGGRFGRDDFIYDRFRDEYRCPAGERLIYRMASEQNGMTMHRYWSSSCGGCALKDQCTPGTERRVTRWEHEDVLERAQARLDHFPDAMRIRRSTVEHPFGTIKHWMGASHFLTKTLKRVSTEMSLHVLAYNMKRVLNIVTMTSLMKAMRA
jgi:transposase